MIKKRILIVDDQKEILTILNDFLSKNGWEIILCKEAKNALAKIKSLKPDLILLDLLFPDGDGFEIYRNLNKDPEIRGIPVIIISGFGGLPDKNEAYELGAIGYFVKPFALSDLNTEIARVLSSQETRL